MNRWWLDAPPLLFSRVQWAFFFYYLYATVSALQTVELTRCFVRSFIELVRSSGAWIQLLYLLHSLRGAAAADVVHSIVRGKVQKPRLIVGYRAGGRIASGIAHLSFSPGNCFPPTPCPPHTHTQTTVRNGGGSWYTPHQLRNGYVITLFHIVSLCIKIESSRSNRYPFTYWDNSRDSSFPFSLFLLLSTDYTHFSYFKTLPLCMNKTVRNMRTRWRSLTTKKEKEKTNRQPNNTARRFNCASHYHPSDGVYCIYV